MTHKRLLEVINYDPVTGVMTWKKPTARRCKVGDVVGTISRGYRRVVIDGAGYQAHRLAWFYFYGTWPNEIDHKNLNRQDNRIANLREATRRQNQANKPSPSTNTSGFKGVYLKRRKWAAQIKSHGEVYYLGTFQTPQEAHAAYSLAAQQFFGEFARA